MSTRNRHEHQLLTHISRRGLGIKTKYEKILNAQEGRQIAQNKAMQSPSLPLCLIL